MATDTQYGFVMGFSIPEEARRTVAFAHQHDFDSLWVGDHIAFAVPITDALTQLTYAAALTDRLTLGTGIYLLPLRHPVPVAKQVAALDTLSGGRLIFGIGVGGEFPGEFAACGVPVNERGARLDESIQILKQLWTGDKVSHQGKHFQFKDVQMLPKPGSTGGPPIWCGGRKEAALRRCGRLADGYISYVVTPDMYKSALQLIAAGAASAGRSLRQFGTAHLLFARVGDNYEDAFAAANAHLSQRYAMDFSAATKKYTAVGRPEDVAARMDEFRQAGVRHFVLDMVGPNADRFDQLERFASDIRPLLV